MPGGIIPGKTSPNDNGIESDEEEQYSPLGINKHQLKNGNVTPMLLQQQQQQQNQRSNSLKSSSSMPSMPPPPPPPPPAPAPVPTKTISRSNTNISTTRSSSSSTGGNDAQNEVQEELKQVLTLFREKRRNLDIIKTPEIYIQQSSSANEVERWLKAKGFSDNVLKKLHGLNGNELFALKRTTLEEFCGHDEGKRLASQITIQRNVSGYKTARTSELQAILARARQKTEQPAVEA